MGLVVLTKISQTHQNLTKNVFLRASKNQKRNGNTAMTFQLGFVHFRGTFLNELSQDCYINITTVIIQVNMMKILGNT